MTRLAPLLLLAALLAGCDRDEPAPVQGRWVIATVNGDSLPVEMGEIMFGETRATAELDSGVLDIGALHYGYTTRFNGFVEGEPLPGNPYTFFQSGVYSYNGGFVTFTPADTSQAAWTASHLHNPERLYVVEDENEAVLVRAPQ